MNRLIGAIAVVALLAACSTRSTQSRLILTDVMLIDGTGASPRAATVVISGRRIEAVHQPAEFQPARADSVIDGRGLFALPGLWDVHVHLSKAGREALPVLVGMGITSVRDMGGDLDELRAMERAIAAGEVVGPEIYMAGPMLEAPATIERLRVSKTAEPYARTRIAIPDTVRARTVVDSLAQLGVDFIKIREYASPATYRAVVEAAHARGLDVAGHAPFSLPPIEGAALGLTSFEHASYPYPLDTVPATRRAILNAFARSGVTIVPTLVAWETNVLTPDSLAALVADSFGRRDARRRLLSDRLVAEWRADLADMKPRAAGYYQGYRGFLRRTAADLKAMYDAGVPLAAGSDLAGIGIFPGFSLHEELERLVDQVGLTPLQAITSATSAAATLVSAADSVGTIEAGNVADIILLADDPTADIRSTRRLHAVVLRGQLLDAARLRELLCGVPPTWPRDL